MVTVYCNKECIPAAFKKGNLWLIPENDEKPEDLRKNERNEREEQGRYVCG